MWFKDFIVKKLSIFLCNLLLRQPFYYNIIPPKSLRITKCIHLEPSLNLKKRINLCTSYLGVVKTMLMMSHNYAVNTVFNRSASQIKSE